MAYSPLETFDFSGGTGVDVITTYPTLGTIDGTTVGYLKQNASGYMYSAFSTSTPRLLRGASASYTDDQYASCDLTTLTTGFNSDWVYLCLQADAGAAPNENYYALRISNATTKTTEIIEVVSGAVNVRASSTSIAWASGDKALIECVGGVLTAYRDTGGGWVTTGLTWDDSSSPRTGGRPGFGMLPTSGATYNIDNVALGDVTGGGGGGVPIKAFRIIHG